MVASGDINEWGLVSCTLTLGTMESDTSWNQKGEEKQEDQIADGHTCYAMQCYATQCNAMQCNAMLRFVVIRLQSPLVTRLPFPTNQPLVDVQLSDVRRIINSSSSDDMMDMIRFGY